MPIQEIPVSDVQSGMITMKDIQDQNGRVLIHAGSRLSPVAIRRLPKWDINTIFVECEDLVAETEKKIEETIKQDIVTEAKIDKELIAELAKKLRGRFKGIPQDEFYKTYMLVLIKYLMDNDNNGNGIIPGFY